MPPAPRIVILGAGFAALTAVRELRRRNPQVDLTLIAPAAEFVYLPSLIWIPTGLRSGADLIHPLNDFFTAQRVEFIAARVTGIEQGGRVVVTDRGPVNNDALIIATGGRPIKKLPGIEHALNLCEGVASAEAIRERLHAFERGRIAFGFGGNPQEPSAMRGGPMFELLFGIDTWLRRQGRRQRVDLVFFNPAAEPGKRLGDKAVGALLGQMAKRGIATHLGHKLTGMSAQGVTTEGGPVDADLILFMPGLTGPAWLEHSDLPRSPGGFIQADEHCRVIGLDRVYVAGDAGSYPGPDWLPKQAHMADLQARASAENLLLALDGKAPRVTPRVELICIVDAVDSGMLVYRSPNRSWLLPPMRIFHWAKRLFEGRYLQQIRP